jgi:hypothetical protein
MAMRSRWITGVAVAAVMTLTPAVFAHDGHVHKVMGTVTASDAKHFKLKTPSGEVLSIAVNAKTKVTRAKKKAPLADVQVGTRVVVEIGNGEDPLIAGAIQLGATSVK